MELVDFNRNKNILVIDDCEDHLSLIELLLENEGYKVKTANNGTKGLAAIKEQCPELIILDWMMPEISGLEIIKYIKSRRLGSNIPIVLLTANTNLEYEHTQQVDALCYKPFHVENLLNEIKYLLSSQT